MSAARTAGAIGTVLLHGVLLATLAIDPPPLAEPPIPVSAERPGGNEDKEMRLVPTPPVGTGLACANSYSGIGVMVSYSGYVLEVVAGGPAELSGMRVGDQFLNADMFVRDTYSVGRQLALRIERDGQRMDLQVRIDRICYSMEST